MTEEAKAEDRTTPGPETKEEPETPEAEPTKEEAEEVKDSHGQPGINKERHDKEIAERDAKIAELEAKLDKAAKDEEAREALKEAIEELKAEMADKDLAYQLELAGCKSPKAAKALLEDYDGDVAKLKEAEPWLFRTEQKGATGLKPGGASNAEDARAAEARKALGTEKYHAK